MSLKAVVQELELLTEQSFAYINRRTGELLTVSDEDIEMAREEDAEEDDLPAWQAEMLPKIREVLDSDDWVELPNKFDIHEWEIMRRFGDSVGDAGWAQQISRAIQGRGAFRMFRTTVETLGLRDQWFEFRDRALLEIAREALDALAIPYE